MKTQIKETMKFENIDEQKNWIVKNFSALRVDGLRVSMNRGTFYIDFDEKHLAKVASMKKALVKAGFNGVSQGKGIFKNTLKAIAQS